MLLGVQESRWCSIPASWNAVKQEWQLCPCSPLYCEEKLLLLVIAIVLTCGNAIYILQIMESWGTRRASKTRRSARFPSTISYSNSSGAILSQLSLFVSDSHDFLNGPQRCLINRCPLRGTFALKRSRSRSLMQQHGGLVPGPWYPEYCYSCT